MRRVKLKVMGISYSQTQSGAYALLLIEESGNRRIPIIIGGFEAQAIVIKLENLEPPRPLTHDLFKNFADQFGITVMEVMIYKLEEGVFYSRMVCNNGEKEFSIDSRTSDAVAIALRFGCPIFIDEEILEKAQITNATSESDIAAENSEVTEPSSDTGTYSSNSDEELKKMLEESVMTEDYEKAAALRDELEKRKKKGKK